MSELELKEILEKHNKWLNNGEGGERADLSGADLSGADLSEANLRWANLSEADIKITPLYNEGTCFYALQCPEEGSFIGFKKCR